MLEGIEGVRIMLGFRSRSNAFCLNKGNTRLLKTLILIQELLKYILLSLNQLLINQLDDALY